MSAWIVLVGEVVHQSPLLLVVCDPERERGACQECPIDLARRASSHVEGPTYHVTIGNRARPGSATFTWRLCARHAAELLHSCGLVAASRFS